MTISIFNFSFSILLTILAEREGFEPSIPVKV